MFFASNSSPRILNSAGFKKKGIAVALPRLWPNNTDLVEMIENYFDLSWKNKVCARKTVKSHSNALEVNLSSPKKESFVWQLESSGKEC
jgi:hypothetical protein